MSMNAVRSLETFQWVPGAEEAGPDGRRGSISAHLRARKLSFNPLPEEWDPPELRQDEIQAIGAFEVSKWKRMRKY